ncbi:MAG: hypothetical protein E6I94_11615, partial [Chloroflexi bacterium]
MELVDLQRALSHLKPDDGQLLALLFVAGFDSTEIARHVGGSPSGVRSRLAPGRPSARPSRRGWMRQHRALQVQNRTTVRRRGSRVMTNRHP